MASLGCSADADKKAPQPRENGAGQNVSWTATECAAVSAHLHAERANFLIAGGVEQGGHDRQYGGYKIHGLTRNSSELVSLEKSAESFRTRVAYSVTQDLNSPDTETWIFREKLLQQGDKCM